MIFPRLFERVSFWGLVYTLFGSERRGYYTVQGLLLWSFGKPPRRLLRAASVRAASCPRGRARLRAGCARTSCCARWAGGARGARGACEAARVRAGEGAGAGCRPWRASGARGAAGRAPPTTSTTRTSTTITSSTTLCRPSLPSPRRSMPVSTYPTKSPPPQNNLETYRTHILRIIKSHLFTFYRAGVA